MAYGCLVAPGRGCLASSNIFAFFSILFETALYCYTMAAASRSNVQDNIVNHNMWFLEEAFELARLTTSQARP
jgi:hypothetical protein